MKNNFKKITPLRIYILIVLLFELSIALTPLYQSKSLLTAILIWIPIYSLIPAILIEVFITIWGRNLSFLEKLIISITGMLIAIYGSILFNAWNNDIENELFIPNTFHKDYLVVVYQVSSGQSITPSIGVTRTRKIKFDKSGIFYTSDQFENSDLVRIHPPISIIYKDGKRVSKNYFSADGNFQGKPYTIISLAEKKYYGGYDCDSMFKAEGINFK